VSGKTSRRVALHLERLEQQLLGHLVEPRAGASADDRVCLNAILFVLRTGCQWNALNATGICPSSTAHDRFQQWVQAGVFGRLWAAGLPEYDKLKGIDWAWQSMDGAMTKAPLGGGKSCQFQNLCIRHTSLLPIIRQDPTARVIKEPALGNFRLQPL